MERSPGIARYAVHRDEEISSTIERYDPATNKYVVWDLSDPNLEPRFRAYKRPPGSKAANAYDVDIPLPKVSGGSTGKVLGFARFTTVRPLLECEIVVVDLSVVNAGSPSGKRETQVKTWDARVEAALVA